LGIRKQLFMLIETHALFRLSNAIDMKMMVDTYKVIISHMFRYDPYGNEGVYAKRPEEEETQWLSRAADGLTITETTAMDTTPSVWLTSDITILLARFYLIRAVYDEFNLPMVLNYHNDKRFANPTAMAREVMLKYQAGYSIVHVTSDQLLEPNVQTLALSHMTVWCCLR
jgi:hypothetical protein